MDQISIIIDIIIDVAVTVFISIIVLIIISDFNLAILRDKQFPQTLFTLHII